MREDFDDIDILDMPGGLTQLGINGGRVECFDDILTMDLPGIQTLLGLDGGLSLNTGVIGHAIPPHIYEHEFVVTVGVSGAAITLADVTAACRSVPRDAFQRGRSYYWEGVVLSPDRRFAHITWGS